MEPIHNVNLDERLERYIKASKSRTTHCSSVPAKSFAVPTLEQAKPSEMPIHALSIGRKERRRNAGSKPTFIASKDSIITVYKQKWSPDVPNPKGVQLPHLSDTPRIMKQLFSHTGKRWNAVLDPARETSIGFTAALDHKLKRRKHKKKNTSPILTPYGVLGVPIERTSSYPREEQMIFRSGMHKFDLDRLTTESSADSQAKPLRKIHVLGPLLAQNGKRQLGMAVLNEIRKINTIMNNAVNCSPVKIRNINTRANK